MSNPAAAAESPTEFMSDGLLPTEFMSDGEDIFPIDYNMEDLQFDFSQDCQPKTVVSTSLVPLNRNLAALVADAPGSNGSGSFRLVQKKFMLTFKGHLDKENLATFLCEKLKGEVEYSIAHETGESGYQHTHALVSLSAKPDIKNSRALDFEGAHPNITLPKSVEHWHNMITYLGKEDSNVYGKITVKRNADERFTAACDYVRGCTTLRQVFECTDMTIASTIASRLPYFKELWSHCGLKTPSKALHSTGFSRPMLDLRFNWLIYGAAGTGKSNFALHHFKHGVLISHIDDLKKIDDLTDGIVFDDMAFNKYPASAIIHLLDREMDRSIHARYNNAMIPANIPKIFTSNRDDIFVPETPINEEQEAAIKRRYKVLHVTAPLYE